jgi:hypothetical protein
MNYNFERSEKQVHNFIIIWDWYLSCRCSLTWPGYDKLYNKLSWPSSSIDKKPCSPPSQSRNGPDRIKRLLAGLSSAAHNSGPVKLRRRNLLTCYFYSYSFFGQPLMFSQRHTRIWKQTRMHKLHVHQNHVTYVMTQWIPNTVSKRKREYYNQYMTKSLINVSSERTTSNRSSEWNYTVSWLVTRTPWTHRKSSSLSSSPDCVDAINKQAWAHVVNIIINIQGCISGWLKGLSTSAF